MRNNPAFISSDLFIFTVKNLVSDLFQKLFRQDLLVASLFRNFLLAERIMRSFDCTPVSSPKLPSTHQHPMWLAWDWAVDGCLLQLPAILDGEQTFKHSTFFEEQLTAFEVWLLLGSEKRKPPEQLPIVLQVKRKHIAHQLWLGLLFMSGSNVKLICCSEVTCVD